VGWLVTVGQRILMSGQAGAEHPPAPRSRPRALNLLVAEFRFLLSFPCLMRCSAWRFACGGWHWPGVPCALAGAGGVQGSWAV